jgi:serine protease Do
VSGLAAPESSIDLAGLADALRRVTVEVMDAGVTLGSGVLWPAGYVVTNAHVVRGPRATLQLVDGRRLRGPVMARDAAADLALIRIAGAGMPAATLADLDAARVGALVVAVGHPFGVRGALTAGIVHAIGPIAPGGPAWIQADLRLAPGNSGGPLADAAGRLVGLNARVAGPLALSVPMSRVIAFARAIGAV